eukprot:m.13202 g.13202  ORF g.13202 m.13202 type:complete len:187 (-) comp4806_c0_seq1:238-798(-)
MAVRNENDDKAPGELFDTSLYNGPTPQTWTPPKPGDTLSAMLPDPSQKQVEEFMQHNCFLKSGIAYVGGYGFGMLFGLFFSSMSGSPLPMHQPGGANPATLAQQQLQTQNWRAVMKETGSKMVSTGKQFAMIGAMFAGTECALAAYNGKEDIKTSMVSFAPCAKGRKLTYMLFDSLLGVLLVVQWV